MEACPLTDDDLRLLRLLATAGAEYGTMMTVMCRLKGLAERLHEALAHNYPQTQATIEEFLDALID